MRGDSTEGCVIAFTKDRTETLEDALNQLTNLDTQVIVLDDSTTHQTAGLFRTHAGWKDFIYHGKRDQEDFIEGLGELKIDVEPFIITLGLEGWHLGYVRNYALILARRLGFKKVLFMDDDIIVKDDSLVEDIIANLDRVDFVGARVTGMPDDSVLGHIERKLGHRNDFRYYFLSGGFLACKLDSVTEFFLNDYNEDWIWLLLHGSTRKYLRYGEVYQIKFDPFEDAIGDALREEFGGILFEGVGLAAKKGDFSLLTQDDFWNVVIRECSQHISEIRRLSEEKRMNVGMKVCSALLEYHHRVRASDFVQILDHYNQKRTKWLSLLEELENQHHD